MEVTGMKYSSKSGVSSLLRHCKKVPQYSYHCMLDPGVWGIIHRLAPSSSHPQVSNKDAQFLRKLFKNKKMVARKLNFTKIIRRVKAVRVKKNKTILRLWMRVLLCMCAAYNIHITPTMISRMTVKGT
jgi:hypothetical protein